MKQDKLPIELLVDPFRLGLWMARIRKEAKKEISQADFASEQTFDAKVASIIQDVTDDWFELLVAHVKNTLIEENEPIDLTKIDAEIRRLLGEA